MTDSASGSGTRLWDEVWHAKDFDLSVQRRVAGPPLHRVVAASNRPGAVVVVEDTGRVLVIRHDRPAIDRTLWEFPRGFASEHDSGAASTGLRELIEETGIRGSHARMLGPIWADSGLLAGSIEVVVVSSPGASASAVHGDGEARGARWLAPGEFIDAISCGEISDGITLAAWAVWSSHRPGESQ